MWNKLDDKLHSHRKPRKAGLAAMGLWTVCLSYCGDQLTDGFVPAWFVATWVPGRPGIRLAEQLVAAELWERAELSDEKGWVFHDYLDHNPSREAVLADREFERRRKAEQRKKVKDKAHAEAMSQWDTRRDSQWVSGLPDPTRPDPTRSSGSVGIDRNSSSRFFENAHSPKSGTSPAREDENTRRERHKAALRERYPDQFDGENPTDDVAHAPIAEETADLRPTEPGRDRPEMP